MGLKDDIYKAFEKNLGKKYLDADAKGKEKVEALANALNKDYSQVLQKADEKSRMKHGA